VKVNKTVKKNQTVKKLKLADICVGKRHRRNLGNIASLAASIADVGLLQPVVVTPDGGLVAGYRRLAALKRLGWSEAPVHVAAGFDEAVPLLKAERDENVQREALRPSECVSLGGELERLVSREAKGRKRRAGLANLPNASGSKLPPLGDSEKGKTRDHVGAAVGMSGRTYEKARAVIKAAAANAKQYRRLREEMDRTGRVDGAFKRLQVMKQEEALKAGPPPLPGGPFHVIAADPPWRYEHRQGDLSKIGALPYPTMTLDQIKALQVRSLAAKDAILWLWTTNTHLPHAFEVARAWGFEYKTMLTWVKNRPGLGDWLRGATEHCLMCVRGRPVVTLTNQSTALPAKVREHSRKPEEFFRLVESLCPGHKVELFARERRRGWQAHGSDLPPAETGEAKADGPDRPVAGGKASRPRVAGRTKPPQAKRKAAG
jgi:N6-adenosine-specific RNA methylase IME4